MRPIVGGNVPPDRVVGRDEFISKMWAALEDQSIVLVSERRIGKTSVLKKMFKEPREGWRPIYMPIQSVNSPIEFVGQIIDAVTAAFKAKGRVVRPLQRILGELAGERVGTWTIPQLANRWKRLLADIMQDIQENCEQRIVFLWDELPLMISNIMDVHGTRLAMELLDVLRDHRLKDEKGTLRMVFTGSIGLHLVVSELLKNGYRNDPTNDMVTYSMEGLEPQHARELARQGLEGLIELGDLKAADSIDEIAKAIAKLTDGLPYYVNYAVSRLAECRQPIQVGEVEGAVNSLLLDPEDTAHFSHFTERIEVYYQFDEQAQELAFAILRVLCRKRSLLSEKGIWDSVSLDMPLTNRDFFQKTLALLIKDHYLIRGERKGERAYRFKYRITQEWWLKNRG